MLIFLFVVRNEKWTFCTFKIIKTMQCVKNVIISLLKKNLFTYNCWKNIIMANPLVKSLKYCLYYRFIHIHCVWSFSFYDFSKFFNRTLLVLSVSCSFGSLVFIKNTIFLVSWTWYSQLNLLHDKRFVNAPITAKMPFCHWNI